MRLISQEEVLILLQLQDASNESLDRGEGSHKQSSVLMGIAHRSRPHWGVQFHPESVATMHGDTLMRNFFACCEEHADRSGPASHPSMLHSKTLQFLL